MGRWQESHAPAIPPRELRERLRHAEETLRAIRQGEVDAFVVAGGSGPRVAVLEGFDHPYIALLERINEGAVTLSSDGQILYCNRFLAGFLRIPREQLIGSALRDVVTPDDRAVFDSLLARGIEAGSHGGLTMLSADGTRHQVLLSLSPLAPVLEGGKAPERGPAGVIGIVTDLDEVKAAEQKLEARARQRAGIVELGGRALAGVSLDALFEDATNMVVRTLQAARCEVAEVPSGGEGLRSRAVTVAPQGGPGGTESAISVEVPGEDAPFGVLEVACRGPRGFSEDDRSFLQAVANVLAAAIIRKRAEDLRRWLLEELTRSRDGERRRLSRELHDETRQSLWALVVGLNALETTAGPEHARDSAHRLHAIASSTLDDIGRLARGLHPAALDDHGLVAAATQYLRDFTASHGIPVTQDVDNVESMNGRLPPDAELTLYRILQEALTNVARHARARSVRVTLRRVRDAAELTVADDGIGFVVEPGRSPLKPGGLGLHGMRERASMLGGEVSVASQPGAGTTVTARVPFEVAAAP